MCEDALKLVSVILISPFQHGMFHDPQEAISRWEMSGSFQVGDLGVLSRDPLQTAHSKPARRWVKTKISSQTVLLCAWCCLEEFGLRGSITHCSPSGVVNENLKTKEVTQGKIYDVKQFFPL